MEPINEVAEHELDEPCPQKCPDRKEGPYDREGRLRPAEQQDNTRNRTEKEQERDPNGDGIASEATGRHEIHRGQEDDIEEQEKHDSHRTLADSTGLLVSSTHLAQADGSLWARSERAFELDSLYPPKTVRRNALFEATFREFQVSQVQWSEGTHVDVSCLRATEAETGYDFPHDFVALVVDNDTAVPTPECYLGRRFGMLLSVDPSQRRNIAKLLRSRSDLFPKGIVPFASDPGGNYLCFDFRRDRASPTIVYLDHEQWDDSVPDQFVTAVAGSFSELVNMLHDSR